MRIPMRPAAAAIAATAALALTAPALGHQTVSDRGVAVTLHVLPDDEPVAGKPATIVAVKVTPPKGGRFTFGSCTCRVKVAAATGHVLLNRRTGKRTPFVFPDAAAYEITYSGSYRAKSGRTGRFSARLRHSRVLSRALTEEDHHMTLRITLQGRARRRRRQRRRRRARPARPVVGPRHRQRPAAAGHRRSPARAARSSCARPNETRDSRTPGRSCCTCPPRSRRASSVRQSPDWKIRIVRAGHRQEGRGRQRDPRRQARLVDGAHAPTPRSSRACSASGPRAGSTRATPQKLCFGIAQYYRNADGSRKKPEIVNWTGDPATADTPRSCVDVAAAPPKS